MAGPWEQYQQASTEQRGPWNDYAQQPVAVQAGKTLMDIPRQIGLTARYGMEGLGQAIEPVTELPRQAINAVSRALYTPKTSDLVTGAGAPQAGRSGQVMAQLADYIGLPKPEGANERVIGDISRMVAGAGGIMGGASALARGATGGVQKVLNALSANPGQQAISAAGAGGAGGAVREAGGGDAAQFAAALAGGLGTAAAVPAATKLYDTVSNAARSLLTSQNTVAEINLVLNNVLRGSGIEVGQIPLGIRSQLADEVRTAIRTGGEVDPAVVRRIAEYGMVGATPTRGTVTLDPVQITQERNTAKLGVNSLDPRLHQLANVQNQNNRIFIERLNDMGAGTPVAGNPTAAGQRAIDTIQARDARAASIENRMYKQARDSAGRPIELDRDGFIMAANNALGAENKGAFLPPEIGRLLEQIRTGTATLLDGRQVPMPFNVDVIDNLKTTLASASRSAKDGNQRAAIGIVRDALENAQPRAVGRQVGGNQLVDPAALAGAQGQADEAATAAMAAFDRARRHARALRGWRGSTPGVTAALENPNPDRFVQDFIIGTGNNAQAANVEALMRNLRRDPEAARAVRESVAGWLKSKTLNGSSDEIGNFSQSGFNKALNQLGENKLRALFPEEDVAMLRALGRVSGYEMVQPKGSAVNNSNTAGAIMGILDRMASSTVLRTLPLGLDRLMSELPANITANIRTRQALNPTAAISTPPRRQVPLSALLLAPSVPNSD